LMFRWNWRFALAMTLWLVPGWLLYTSYYFGKQRPGMWYLRFFLTLFPPMLVAAMWLLRSAIDGARQTRGGRSVAAPIALGLFTAASCAVGLWISLPVMEREQAGNWNLAYTCQQIVRDCPTKVNGKKIEPVVFADVRSPGH